MIFLSLVQLVTLLGLCFGVSHCVNTGGGLKLIFGSESRLNIESSKYRLKHTKPQLYIKNIAVNTVVRWKLCVAKGFRI